MCWFTASFLLDWLRVVVVFAGIVICACLLVVYCFAIGAFVCWWLLTWLWCFAVGDCVYCVG